MRSSDNRPLLLCIESDAAVRRALEAVGREKLRFHFAESLSDRVLDRRWCDWTPAAGIALVEVPDCEVATFARLSRLRETNPEMKIVLTACYDCDYQLAADRLLGLSEHLVFRPFEVEPVIRTLLLLGREEAVT